VSEEADDSLEGGISDWAEIGAALLSLFFGLLVPAIFNSFTQTQALSVYLVAFGVFAACILYGELAVSIPSGVAFGLGMLSTSFAGQNWWLLALAICAVTINLVKNGLWQPGTNGLEHAGLESSIDSG
jgi:hypothetical protein